MTDKTTDFYRFPPMKDLSKWDNVEQIAKIEEEIEEAHKSKL